MEVEREIKKMTLGHDFGAGAPCLKCKDKCEGFELHFWRKICRNCKCGLTDHDVQMNSEENKKVGRLFEDTKYTRLIAKLKTDGVPTYRGNMVTISLPSTGTAYVMPPSASSSVVMPPGTTASSVQHGAGHRVPGSGAAFGGASFGGVPGSGVSASGVPGRGVSASGVSASGVPGSGVSASGVPGSGVSASGVPGSGVPGSGVPGSGVSANVVRKDVPMKSVTYEWAPPVANQYLAVRYIELLPPEKRPVAGTEGAAYRRQQMACQLPEHDQDPSLCHELSPAEVKKMEQFVRKYKDEALGVGDVRLPEEMALVRAGAQGGVAAVVGTVGAAPRSRPGVGATGDMATVATAGSRPGAGSAGGLPGGPGAGTGATGDMATAGAMGLPGAPQAGLPQQNYNCNHCEKPMRQGQPAVYAERAGYDKLWHPACFVCCTCSELLVDMIYFWKKGKLYCGRHYGDSEKPRCGGCDELIFCMEYTLAESQNWHLKHFCCFECDCILAGEIYVMEKDKPVCTPCYMNNHAVKCMACQKLVEPEAQRVSYGEHHWHAEPQCFQCSGCSKCLVGERFMVVQGSLFCSVECKKKILT